VEKDGFKIFVPNPQRGDVGKALLSRIIKELGIGADEFMKL